MMVLKKNLNLKEHNFSAHFRWVPFLLMLYMVFLAAFADILVSGFGCVYKSLRIWVRISLNNMQDFFLSNVDASSKKTCYDVLSFNC